MPIPRIYLPGQFNASNLPDAPQEYRDSLKRMMSVMAFTEDAVAVGIKEFVDSTHGSEKDHMLDAIEDETRHGRLVYELLEEIGVSRKEADSLAVYSTRPESLRASIDWMKPGKSWADFVVYSFLLDRAGNYHLRNYLESSYAPWARVCASIIVEEEGHGEFGIQELRKLAEKDKQLAEETLALWYPKILDFFGAPHSESTAKYVSFGLKVRDNADMCLEFRVDTSKLLSEMGLNEPMLSSESYPFFVG